MPYKDKEDRNEAVRRHRERQKAKHTKARKVAEIEASLGGLLRLMGFQEVPYEAFVECCKNYYKDSNGIWHDRSRGTIVHPPDQVFFGINTLIAGNHLNDQMNAFLVLLQNLMEYAESYDDEG